MALMKPVTECLSQLKWLWFTRKRPLAEFAVFDNASRGGLDSLKLLIMCRGLHLASLGAALIFVALAFGPFTQQVLTYPSKLRVDGPAWAPQAVYYTGKFSFTPFNILYFESMILISVQGQLISRWED